MDRIVVATAGDVKFRKHVERSLTNIRCLGYMPVVYDLGDLGFGLVHTPPAGDLVKGSSGFIPCNFKHDLIRCALELGERVVYLDGDAIIVQAIDDVFNTEFDVGVTIRTAKEIETYKTNPRVGYFNTGVMFFKQGRATSLFLDQWEARTREVGIEQQALNDVVCPFVTYPNHEDHVRCGMATVKIVECVEYNCFYPDKSRAKIIHYKNTVK